MQDPYTQVETPETGFVANEYAAMSAKLEAYKCLLLRAEIMRGGLSAELDGMRRPRLLDGESAIEDAIREADQEITDLDQAVARAEEDGVSR